MVHAWLAGGLAALYRPRAGWGWWLGQFAGGWVDSLVAGSVRWWLGRFAGGWVSSLVVGSIRWWLGQFAGGWVDSLVVGSVRWWLGRFAGGWVSLLVAGSIASPAGGVRGRIACPVQPCEWLAAGWTVGRANGLGCSRLAIRARPPPSRPGRVTEALGVVRQPGWLEEGRQGGREDLFGQRTGYQDPATTLDGPTQGSLRLAGRVYGPRRVDLTAPRSYGPSVNQPRPAAGTTALHRAGRATAPGFWSAGHLKGQPSGWVHRAVRGAGSTFVWALPPDPSSAR